MTAQALPFKNPEVLGPMGFELPNIETSFRDTFEKPLVVVGVVAGFVGGMAVGINSLANPDKADAGVEVCTALSGEIPQPLKLPKATGVDLMAYTPAFKSELCALIPNTATTYIENVGTKTARGVKFNFSGSSYITSAIHGLRVDDKPIQIVEGNQLPTNAEESCARTVFNQDWTGARTTTIVCGYLFGQRDLEPGQKMKIDIDLTPQRTSNPTEVGGQESPKPRAPYVSFFTEDKFTPETLPEDKNFNNNSVTKLVYVRDSQGNSRQQPEIVCQAPVLSIKAPGVLSNRKGILTSVLNAKSKINGVGNGAHKDPRVRAKAARIVVTVGKSARINPKLLPKGMIKEGNKVIIDIPKKGVVPDKNFSKGLPFSFIGNGVGFNAKLYTPKGTVANCGKPLIISSNSLKSASL